MPAGTKLSAPHPGCSPQAHPDVAAPAEVATLRDCVATSAGGSGFTSRSGVTASAGGAVAGIRSSTVNLRNLGFAIRKSRQTAKPPGRRAANPPGRRAANPPGRWAARPSGCRDARPPRCRAASPPGRQNARPPGRRGAGLPNRRAAGRQAAKPARRRLWSSAPRHAGRGRHRHLRSAGDADRRRQTAPNYPVITMRDTEPPGSRARGTHRKISRAPALSQVP
jgi:hypothetical protein